MKTKVILILIMIVVLIVLSLSAGAFVGGYGAEVEAESKHIEGQIVCLDKIYIFNGQDYVPVVKEPNEPQKVSLDFIPTWPAYIELEKDLIIKGHPDIHNIGGREVDLSLRIELSKGTKIYFRGE